VRPPSSIGDEIVSGDGTEEHEVASESKPANWTKQSRLLAEKTSPTDSKMLRKHFSIWDGTPQKFQFWLAELRFLLV
jgi:hypothetical protein